MRRFRNLLILSILSYKCFATHIVGGELFLEPLKDNIATHRITLNFYFDAITGNPNAEDLTLTVYFFRKKNDAMVGTATLQRIYKDYIQYNTPACERGDQQTLLIKYQADIILKNENFSDPEGYYVTWERCCRNATITNIKDPGGTGMVFYLEFPPITTFNTSPKFSSIVADYICINQQFLFDFSASDADGDSLTYQLITPWAGYTSRTAPLVVQTGSQNYPEIAWNTGYSLANVMGSDTPLAIDPVTGVLTIKSSRVGLFVFSVMVNEYRKGVKIGRVKRDFQIRVIDCHLNNPPDLIVKDGNTNALFKDGDLIVLKKNDKKCLNIAFTDSDIGQLLNISVKGGNVDASKITIASPNQLTISKQGDTLKTQVCFDNCSLASSGGIISFALTVSDNGCPASLKKTVVVRVQFEDTTPLDPKISTTLPDNIVNISYGDTLRFKVNGEGVTNDTLQLSGSSPTYNLSDVGILFKQPITGINKVSSDFVFIANCNAVKAGRIPILFTNKESRCGVAKQVSTSVIINVASIPNNQPLISTTLPNNQAEIILNPSGNQEIKFNVAGQDIDNQQLTTVALPAGFDLKSANMTFDNKNGIKITNGVFTWNVNCALLNGKDSREFDVSFVVADNACQQKKDSVLVKLVLKDVNVAINTFKPYNTFTPNNDGINDYFSLENLPNDNCKRQFVRFELYNRWGKSIFSTQDRNFKWSGEDYETGDYFYAVTFTDEAIKGIVTLIR